jgi:hypothetical protein
LALLAASFAFCGPPAYAETEDTTSIQVLTFDAVGNPGEIIVALDCDAEDGMGNCPVGISVAETAAAETTVADAFDPAVLQSAAEPAADAYEPVIRSVDTIIVQGDTDAVTAEPAQTAGTLAAEPAAKNNDASLLQTNEEKAEASAAIVVEITQSSTVAVPGQHVDDEPEVTGSNAESSPTTPVLMLDGKNGDEDF